MSNIIVDNRYTTGYPRTRALEVVADVDADALPEAVHPAVVRGGAVAAPRRVGRPAAAARGARGVLRPRPPRPVDRYAINV